MSTRTVSIAFQTNKSPQEYQALARLVNEYAFHTVSVYCDAPFHPSFGPLLLMAPYITKAHLGPAAVSPFRIHPIDIAANTALLNQLAPGRVYVGLARGAWLAGHGISEPKQPVAGIREAVQIIQNLLMGEPAGVQGKVFQLSSHVRAPYPVPGVKLPLLIGTWGERLAGLAGEIADEVKIGGSTNPAMIPVMRAYLKVGTARTGRSANEVGIVMGAVTVVDEDRSLAKRIAKREVVLYLPVVAALDKTIFLEAELINRIETNVQEGRVEQAANLVSDDLLEKFAFAGNPADLIRQVEALFDAGANRVEFGTPHGVDPFRAIRLLGEKVLPAVQQ